MTFSALFYELFCTAVIDKRCFGLTAILGVAFTNHGPFPTFMQLFSTENSTNIVSRNSS